MKTLDKFNNVFVANNASQAFVVTNEESRIARVSLNASNAPTDSKSSGPHFTWYAFARNARRV